MNLKVPTSGLNLPGSLILIFLLSSTLTGLIYAQPVHTGDSLVLVELYNNTGGTGWKNASGWLSGNVMDWYGVKLSGDGNRVVSLGLTSNDLVGPLPASIGNLSKLEILNLSNNRLSGSLPFNLGDMDSLKYLNLSANDLGGGIPASIGQCARLVNIWLPGNLISGNIPAEIGNLSELRELKLYQNRLSGMVPASIINLSSLQIIDLSVNLLEGDFPPFPASVTKLDIQGNLFTGLPDMTGNQASLNILYVHHNTLGFHTLIKLVGLNIFTINYYSQWHFPVEIKDEAGKVVLTMKGAGQLETYYEWYQNGNKVYAGPDSCFTIFQAEKGDRFFAQAQSGQLYYTTLYSDTITLQEEIIQENSFVINSNADKELAFNAPDELCTTGDSILVGGVLVPECTLRAAIELVNRMQKPTRTDFTFNMQQGAQIEPEFLLPSIRFPMGLDGSTQDGNLVILNGKKVDNFTDQPSLGLEIKNTGKVRINKLVIEEFGKGIMLENISGAGIHECLFRKNTLTAIQADRSRELEIRNNILSDGNLGIVLLEVFKSEIFGNTLLLQDIESIVSGGIILSQSDSCLIRHNEITLKNASYREEAGGILITASHENLTDSNYIFFCPAGLVITSGNRNDFKDNYLADNERGMVINNRQFESIIYSGNHISRNIIGAGPEGIPGSRDRIGIYLRESHGDLIMDNRISFQKEYGILGEKVIDLSIRGNVIGSESTPVEGNKQGGIQMEMAISLALTDNVISGNGGAGLECSGSYILIEENFIGVNRSLDKIIENEGDGILLRDVYLPVLRGNKVDGNRGNGLTIDGGQGLCLVEGNWFGKEGFSDFGNGKKGIFIMANRVKLSGNHILDQNASHGIYLETLNKKIPDHLEVYNNLIINNQFGILVKDFTRSEIVKNRILYNFSSGLTILGEGSGTVCELNDIQGNGGGTGIHLSGGKAVIKGNRIASDETDGISLEENSTAIISGNNIFQNGSYGVNNTGTGSLVDARKNWWGHTSGPGGSGPGTGDKVSENVLFSPWDTTMSGLCIAGPNDTIVLPSGVPDTIFLFFRDWISMTDTLECSISDSLGWLTNPLTTSKLPLNDSLGAIWEIGVFPQPDDTALLNPVKLVARSISNPLNTDSLRFCLTSEKSRTCYLKILPDTVTIYPGDSVKFNFLAFDQFFGEVISTVNWESAAGSMDTMGIFVAGQTPGIFPIIGLTKDEGIPDTAWVVIMDNTGNPGKVVKRLASFNLAVYPNPSTGSFNVSFQMESKSDARIRLHSMNGELMDELYLNGLLPADYTITMDLMKRSLPAGMYFITLQAGQTHETVKLILVR